MFCPWCGNQNPDDAAFCGSCGAAIPPAPDTKTVNVATTPAVADTDVMPPVSQSAPAMASSPVAQPAPTWAPSPAAQSVPPMTPISTAPNGIPGAAGGVPVAQTPRRSKRVIGIAVAALAVVVVGVVLVFRNINAPVPIDEESFPNIVVRMAVLEQLDEDGDGSLSPKEAEAVTALVYTNNGIQFVTAEDQMGIEAIRQDASQNADWSNGGTSSGGNQGSGSVSAPGDENSQAGNITFRARDLGYFPSVETLILDNLNLTELDLSVVPNVEYVSLLGNPDLESLDLSKNTKIQNLFCDPDVEIIGLDEKVYFYTDLISSMTTGGPSSFAGQVKTVEYDLSGRPTTICERPVTYDNEGRMVAFGKATRGSKEYNSQSYVYGTNGLPELYKQFTEQDGDYPFWIHRFSYDDQGNLTQSYDVHESSEGIETAPVTGEVFDYINGKLVSERSATKANSGEFCTFTFDTEGRLLSESKNGSSSDEYTYDSNGAVISYKEIYPGSTSADYGESYQITRGENSAPVSIKAFVGASTGRAFPYDVFFETNADGYITKVKWESSDKSLYFVDRTVDVSYIKRVGRLENRAAEQFVPVIRLSIGVHPLVAFGGWRSDQFLFSNAVGPVMRTDFLIWTPKQTMMERMGILPNMLANANELKLAQYDSEHQNDGLNLGQVKNAEIPESAQQLIDKAAKVPLPEPPSEFLNDPIYKTVVNEYLDAGKEIAKDGFSASKLSDNYPNIPAVVLALIGMESAYSSSGNNSIDFSYVDLNNDGVNELAVTIPSYISDKDENTRVAAVYGQANGKVQLIAYGAERLACWVTPDGKVVTRGSGGYDTGAYSVYAWNGSTSEVVETFEYTYEDREADRYTIVTKNSDGKEQKSVVSYSEVNKRTRAFEALYPHADLSWTAISYAQ